MLYTILGFTLIKYLYLLHIPFIISSKVKFRVLMPARDVDHLPACACKNDFRISIFSTLNDLAISTPRYDKIRTRWINGERVLPMRGFSHPNVVCRHVLAMLTESTFQSCERCKRRKIKCSGKQPCNKCTQRSAQYDFESEGRKVLVSEK